MVRPRPRHAERHRAPPLRAPARQGRRARQGTPHLGPGRDLWRRRGEEGGHGLAAVEGAGETGVADRAERLQPKEAPAFNQALVGKRLEVLWRYRVKDTGEPVYIWSSGRVVRVADGLADKRSKRAQKILPAGALLWA